MVKEEEDEEGDSDDEPAVAADTMIVRRNRRDKLMSLLEQYDNCPSRTRNNIDDLVLELLDKAEDDVHDMLCDQNLENYQGLDINRDTVKEVRTILQIFPNTVSKRKEVVWGTNEDGEYVWVAAEEQGEREYPIQCLMYTVGPNGWSCNLKAIPFIATLAQLGKDLDQFQEEEERGGLLIEGENG